jgi:hypothetical protein
MTVTPVITIFPSFGGTRRFIIVFIRPYIEPDSSYPMSLIFTAKEFPENVEYFKYLGSTLRNENCVTKEATFGE